MEQSGFTLLEILIAMLVLAVGLLGLAGLQATGLKNNHSAQFRTDAAIHAYDILDKMRLNKAVAKAGEYDIAVADDAPPGSRLVDTDRAAWLDSLAAALPSGDGALATAAGVTTVTVQWDDSRGSGGSITQAFTVSTQL
ncbi:Type IV fimbrial biogenesis protein PilV [hydrothermal vent metagenome]|uniref:Type IV fimbrial biogenesis protein PilV n=1 Tax=hydrothermal vent metagenome TaxID=652676 RepID=A0A3B1B1S0_9ZZZZ